MQVSWGELESYLCGAFALYLVLEGLLPFLNPKAAQRIMARLSQLAPAQMRWGGFFSIVMGLALLWVARNG